MAEETKQLWHWSRRFPKEAAVWSAVPHFVGCECAQLVECDVMSGWRQITGTAYPRLLVLSAMRAVLPTMHCTCHTPPPAPDLASLVTRLPSPARPPSSRLQTSS